MPNSMPLTGKNPQPKFTQPTGAVVSTPAQGTSQAVISSSASGEAGVTDLSAMTEGTGRELLAVMQDIRWLLYHGIFEGDE